MTGASTGHRGRKGNDGLFAREPLNGGGDARGGGSTRAREGGGASDAPRRCLGGARPSRVFSSADADPRRGVAPRKGDAPQRRRERVMTQNLESLWKWRSPESEKREWARFLFRVPSLAKPYLYGWFGLFLPDEDCRINRNSLTELTCIKRHEFHIRVQNKKSPARVLTSSLTSL